MSNAPSSPRKKPLLRGVSHQIAVVGFAPPLVALFASAESATARAGAWTFGASLFTLFVVSATYHRPHWAPRPRDLIGRLDHSAIFILIAGTYTPFCLLRGSSGTEQVVGIWVAAALGVAMSLCWPSAPKPLVALAAVSLGWQILPLVPVVRSALGEGALLLVILGGALYTLGALVYVLRRPDPVPTVFGFHEIFHLFVVVAATCHLCAVSEAVTALNRGVRFAP